MATSGVNMIASKSMFCCSDFRIGDHGTRVIFIASVQ